MAGIKAKQRTWVEEELRIIAGYEVSLLLDPNSAKYKQAQIIAQLERKLTEHGELLKPEQVKNLRRKAEYRQLRDACLRLAESQAATVEDSEILPPTVEFNFKTSQYRRTEAQIRSLSQGVVSDPEPFLNAVEPGQWNETNQSAVNSDYTLFELKRPPKPFQPRSHQEKKLPTNRRARRRILYARTQTLWKKNRTRCAREVLSGDWQKTEGPNVPAGELHRFWQGIFEQPSKADSREVVPKREIQWKALDPIEIEEVKLNLKGFETQTAAGPDGRKLTDIKAVPLNELALLLNKWLYAGTMPSVLLEGRTTLIPKVPGTQDPAQFRPIGVSSLLVRLYHRILARRLDQLCPPSRRQKGFRPGDGIAENTVLIKELLRHSTGAKPQQLHLIFLDVKKAFDSVSHQSLILALQRAGVPPPILSYLKGYYDLSWTRILANGQLGNKVRPSQGVRQGDPLSSFMFNAVIDWCLEEMNSAIGYDIDGHLISYFAFADDLVVVARSQLGIRVQTDLVVSSLGTTGLKVNPTKCSTLTVLVDGKKKAWGIDAEPSLQIDSEYVPALGIRDCYKYLGIQVSASGTKASVRERLLRNLEQISRAPLKPQQRVWILRSNVFPAMLHQLVLADTTKLYLKALDILLRRAVRSWLKLPKDTPLSYFYASVKDGGMGLSSLLYDLPERITSRVISLQCSDDPVVARLATAPRFADRIRKWSKPIYLDGNSMNAGKQLRRLGWSQLLTKSCDGRGLKDAGWVPAAHSWVSDGTGLLSGRLYNAAIAARCNLLPTRARGSRGRSREANKRTCDACGPSQLETLSHISQVCPRTWGPRNKRHNKLASLLARILSRKGYTTIQENLFKTSSGNFKPDLVAWNDCQAVVIDVTVTTDNLPEPNKAHCEKVTKYETPEEISRTVQSTSGFRPWFSAFAVNWRGCVSPKTAADMRELGLTNRELNLLSAVTVENTALIHRHFYQSTFRVKLNRS